MLVGVLAIQGDFALHQKLLQQLNVSSTLVKKKEDLKNCDGLIIPGGESTTFVKQLKEIGLFNEIREFSRKQPIFGTCAGLIALATHIENDNLDSLALIDLQVTRNAYGRQINSFIDTVELLFEGKKIAFEGVFIRAPKIKKIGEGVKPIGYYNNEIVLVENEKIMAATFHPELTDNPLIHEYFLKKIRNFKT